MSNARYIEVDSAYRDRTRDPLPAQFRLEIAQTGTRNSQDARDPVSLASPQIIFTDSLNQVGPSPSLTGVIDAFVPLTIGAAGTQSRIIGAFTVAANDPFRQDDYYAGLSLQDTTTNEVRRILTSKFLNESGGVARIEFSLTRPFSDTAVAGDTLLLENPTDITDVNNPIFFAPTGQLAENFYVECILYNQTRLQSRPIKSYDSIKRLIFLDTSGAAVAGNLQGPIPGAWTTTDTYIIRKESPCLTGVLNNNITSLTDFSLPVTAPPVQQLYKNSFLRMTSGAASGEIERIVNYETLSGTAAGGSLTTLVLPFTIGVNNTPGYYNNMYIQITSGAATGDIRQVTNYTGSTNTPPFTLTVNPAFTGAVVAGDTFVFRSGRISPSFSALLAGGDTFEILCFSYDNFVPMSYTGSVVSQQNEVCYEIELLNLVLPNEILISGFGSRITFYPYVYVELQNLSSATAGNNNIIYSNNPNATRMLFRAAIDDIPNPILSPFIKIDGDGMVQTVKFKPNDNLFFSVRLSNGDIFQTVETDNFSPLQPNPLLQVSALFSIKRL